jgi:hypothetical protein
MLKWRIDITIYHLASPSSVPLTKRGMEGISPRNLGDAHTCQYLEFELIVSTIIDLSNNFYNNLLLQLYTCFNV